MWENRDQKNSEYGHLSRSVSETTQITAYTDLQILSSNNQPANYFTVTTSALMQIF